MIWVSIHDFAQWDARPLREDDSFFAAQCFMERSGHMSPGQSNMQSKRGKVRNKWCFSRRCLHFESDPTSATGHLKSFFLYSSCNHNKTRTCYKNMMM